MVPCREDIKKICMRSPRCGLSTRLGTKELQSSSPSLNPERGHRVNRPRLSETRSSPSKCRLERIQVLTPLLN